MGLVLRAGLVADQRHLVPVLDAADYNRLAERISHGHGYGDSVLVLGGGPSAFRPPLFPYVLGIVYKVFPGTLTAGRLFGALLGAFTVLLIFLIAERLWDRRPALFAAAVAAVFPPLVFLSQTLTVESLFIPLELGAVLALLTYARSGAALRWAIVSGLLCGLAAETRSNGLLLVVPLLLGLFAAGGRAHLRRFGTAAAAALLTVALVLAPWTIRNAVVFHGKFIPVSTETGFGLRGTFSDPARLDPTGKGTWHPPVRDPANVSIYRRHGVTEADVDDALAKAAFRYIGDHPGYASEVPLLNSYRLVNPKATPSLTTLSYNAMSIPHRARTLLTYSYLLVALLALAGIFVVVTRGGLPPGWVWTVPVLMGLSFAAINGAPRYRTVLDPFLILLAGAALAAAVDRLPSKARLAKVRA